MKLIYIEWEDAICDTGWKSEEDTQKWFKQEPMTIKNIGWIYEETDKYIALVCRQSECADGKKDFGLLQKIPKTWIRKRVNLTKYI